MALPAGRYGVTKNQLLKIKKLPMNTIKLIEEIQEELDTFGTAVTHDSTSVVTQSTDLVESGAVKRAIGIDFKNLFNPTVDSISGNVTIEKNADNIYTVNGTAQVDTSYDIGTFTFKANTTYMMSGCPTGLSSEVYLRASNNDFTIQKQDKGSGVVILFDTDTTLNINIRVGAGQTLNNVVFSPMIELGNTKTAYEPYHESVEESKADNSVIGTVEGANASKAWSVGEHFINGGQFKEVTQPIASGGAISDSNTVNKPIADCLAKQATFSITTDASKGIGKIYSNTDRIILGIKANESGRVITPYYYYDGNDIGIWIKVIGSTGNAVTSTNVTGTYYYID